MELGWGYAFVRKVEIVITLRGQVLFHINCTCYTLGKPDARIFTRVVY